MQYDDHSRKSLLDLFYDEEDANLEAVASGEAVVQGDFVPAPTKPACAAIPAASRSN